jgi:signal transduction histidine kinase
MTSLRQQLRRALVGTLAALLGAALCAITAVVWDELVDAFDAALQAKASAVSALVEERDGRVRFDFSPEFLRGFGGERPRNYFQIWNSADASLVRSPSLREENLPRRVGERASRAEYWNVTLPNGRPGRAIGYEFSPQGSEGSRSRRSSRELQLVVASDRDDLNETLGGLLLAVGGCGVLLFAAVWFVVPVVLRRGLAPLDRLGEEVARVDAHSLDARFSVATLPAELRPVGDRLNDLLGRLAASFERERRFSADLAHELRTPIAELRSLAECALKWPESRDPGSDSDALAIATQMEALVTRMLALARGERGELTVQSGAVEPAGMVEAVWKVHAKRAAARGVRANFQMASGSVNADAVLLRSILHNLLENAADYTPAGGELRVKGEVTPGGYRLQLANLAGEITGGDVARLFDRFWRKEAARSEGKHAGLGLSLSRAFATAMGWRLDAAIDAEGWLVFTLETAPNGAK